MVDLYKKYYLDSETIKEILQNGIVVFDTSALLDLYYYSSETRNEIFNKAFNYLKGRLWIPAQVYFEYLKNKSKVSEKPILSYERLLTKQSKDGGYVNSIVDKTKMLQGQSLGEIKNQLKTLKEQTLGTDKHPYLSPDVYAEYESVLSVVENQLTDFSTKTADFQTRIQKEIEKKIAELQTFIARFAANKAKSKQATSRRRLLDKMTVEEMPASSRRYPFVGFEREREVGKDILFVTDVSKTIDGVKLLYKVSFIVNKNDKIAFVGENELAQTTLFKILMGELEPDEGSVKWGQTVTTSYLPKDNTAYFEGCTDSLVDWIRQYSVKKDDVYLRGFLGRMLFSGEEAFKPVNVLSGGEKVRCMLSRMMLSGANVLLLDQPTNHLDMEAIQAVNKGLCAFPGNILLASHDHELLQTTCNRVIEFQPDGTIIDRLCSYDDYVAWKLAKEVH